MRTLDDVLASLPEKERAAVEARAEELITAYSLKQVRQAVRKTQKEVAAATDVGQENVSRLEQRDDMLISTLSGYIAALGGRLRLVADMPNAPVEIVLRPNRKLQVRHSNPAQRGSRKPKQAQQAGQSSKRTPVQKAP